MSVPGKVSAVDHRSTVASDPVFRHRVPIDGLRAVAVLLVLLFHAGMPGMANGYVGVDIFFVLSGYLITTLLVRERWATGRISLIGFYARRMRRLLPAAILVLVVTAILYRLLADPLDLLANRAGFGWASVYLSNWYFLAHSQDYFAVSDAPSPVLHYWSLGVEEQFYLAWPLVLVGLLGLLAARRRLLGPTLTALAAGTLLLSWWIDSANATGAYFNTFARVYQLLAGAALAVWLARRGERAAPSPHARRFRLGSSAIGASGVILAIVLVAGEALSPWLVGVIGVGATVGFLAGIELSPESPLLRPLVSAPAVRIGGWSYAMYLWHWPVIVLGALALPWSTGLAWPLRVILVLAVTMVLSAATGRLVEARTRRISLRTGVQRQVAVATGLAASLACGALVLGVVQAPMRVQQMAAIASAGQVDDSSATTATVDVVQAPADTTAPSDASADPGPAASRFHNAEARGRPSTVLLIGDSHAELWREGFLDAASTLGFTGIMITSSGCPWMDLPALSGQTGEPVDCQDKLWKPALDAARTYQPDLVILISRSVLSRHLVVDGQVLRSGDPGWASVMSAGVRTSLAQMVPLAKQIALVEPYPLTRTPMIDCLSTGAPPASCDQPAWQMPGTESVLPLYRQLASTYPNVTSVSLADLICPGGICPAEVDGLPTFADDNHLTHAFAATLVPGLLQVLADDGMLVRGASGTPVAEPEVGSLP